MQCAWWVVRHHTKDVWKYVITVFGEQFAMTALAVSMLKSPASALDMGKTV